MKKQLLLLFLVLMPIVASAEETWQFDESTGTLTISGTGKMNDYSCDSYNGTYRTTAPWKDYYTSIKSVVIEEGITSIGDWAFTGCSLTSITIPESVTSIGDWTFTGCSSLTSITIPESVTSIGDYAFRGCSSLTSFTIPESVTSIGNGAFYVCSSLTRVFCLALTPPSLGSYNFSGIDVWVPASSVQVYKSTDYWRESNIHSIDEIINWKQTEFYYTGNVQIPEYTNNVNGFSTTMDFTNLHKDVGTWRDIISAKFTDTNNGQNFTVRIPFNYVIKPLNIVASVESTNRLYGDDNPQFKIRYSGFVNGESESVFTNSPTLSTTAIKTSDVGDYPITISGGKAQNYTFVYEPGVLTITKAPLTAKANDKTKKYGENNPSLSINYVGLKNEETAPKWSEALKIETTATKQSDVGTYAITATGVPTNYDLRKIEDGTLTITQAPLTLKVHDATRMYFEEEPSFKFTCYGFVNGDDAQVLTKAPTFTTDASKTSDVGKYQITPCNAEAKNYTISYESGELTITKRTLKATSHSSRQYGETNPEFSIEYIGFVNNETEDVLSIKPIGTTTATKESSVGNYPITVSGGEATNYDFTYEQGVLSITKRTLKATSHCSRPYGGENPILPIEYEGFVNDEDEKVLSIKPVATTTATKESSVGNYPITVSGGEATNYDFTYEQGVLTVTKAPLSAKVVDATKVYGEQNPNFSMEYYGLKNDETVPAWITKPTFQTEATEASGVGHYIVKAIDGVAMNYDLAIEDGTLTITQAPLIIKANDATRQYYEDEPDFDFLCTGFLNNDDKQVLTKKPTITTSATKVSHVGKYKITPSEAEAKNYTISYESGELTITKRTLKATSHSSRQYGEKNPEFSIEYTGFVNNETEDVLTIKPIGTTTATKESSVGNYPITVSGGEATNYDFTYEQGVLTVTKASLMAKVVDATKVYGEQNPNFSLEYYGLKNDETVPAWTTKPTFQTEATKKSGVGEYMVSAVDGVPVNYDIEFNDGTLSITPAPLTIKANDAERPYYSDDPLFSYECTGFANGENESVLTTKPQLSTTATPQSGVGTYDINVGETSSPNYNISYSKGTLTITPRLLTASVGNYERPYNEENPDFKVEFEGFAGGEDERVLLSKPVARTAATRTSDVGTYRIDVSGGNADNYTFSYVSGQLTINQAEQTIQWDQDLSILGVGDQVELKAEASSGLPITYTIDDTSFAEIYTTGQKTFLDCKAKGEFQILAVQNGNKNYYASQRIRRTLVIGDESSVNAPLNSPVEIHRTTYGIRLRNVAVGERIQVLATDGVQLQSLQAEEEAVDLLLEKEHIYIIIIGIKVFKISL